KRDNEGITPEMRAIEDKFFGETNALEYEANEGAEQQVSALRASVSGEVQETTDSNSPTQVIDRLQEQERLPESIHTPVLVSTLKLLGEKLGLRVQIDDDITLFPNNLRTLKLSSANLDVFLRRGAIAATFLMGMMPIKGYAQELIQPGMDIMEQATETVVEGGYMFHWEHLTMLLLLLGISIAAAHKILKKTNKEKKILSDFEKLKAAKESGDSEAATQAKKGVYTGMMGDLPADMDEAIQATDVTDPKELQKALKIKKKTDALINKITLDVEGKMILPNDPTLEVLNKKRDEVVHAILKHLDEIDKLMKQLIKEWEKAPSGSFLKQQIEFEKKKLHITQQYLILMKKKWLILIDNAKDEIIKGANPESLSEKDKVKKGILNLQQKLNELLDGQAGMDPTDFQTQLDQLDDELTNKTNDAAEAGIGKYSKPEPEVIAGNSIDLHKNGNYNHATGVSYSVNGTEHNHALGEQSTVQVWINPKQQILMNFNYKGVLVDSTILLVANDTGQFQIASTNQALDAYIAEQEADEIVQALEASAELGPDSEPVLKELAGKVEQVSKAIKADTYGLFGSKVEADDEAIENHLIRVHKEYHQGKAKTVIKLTLSEAYWKKALAELDSHGDIPKHNIPFNFEGPKGGKVNINQNMRRFNVVVNGKQASVLVTSDSTHLSMIGEVRIILDSGEDFSQDEIEKVFAEAVTRLGIQSHIKPPDANAKTKLRKKLKDHRREDEAPANSTTDVHSEYSAERVVPVSVAKLKGKGLHSVYHQFNSSVLENIFKAKSLMSTSTRWSKGILQSGMSSTTDMAKGGGTEVFTRIHTKNSAKSGIWYSSGKPALVYKPEIFSRMDCYCYSSDQYGSKQPSTYSQRVSPLKLTEMMSSHYATGHEVMFHDAINLDDAAYLVVDNPTSYIARLEKMGITEVGGKPLSQFVISESKFQSLNSV
ncbi:MAG: hypothetical protein O3B47_01610, partial [bacterium]|nr:hypothetical protein [bacterium]